MVDKVLTTIADDADAQLSRRKEHLKQPAYATGNVEVFYISTTHTNWFYGSKGQEQKWTNSGLDGLE